MTKARINMYLHCKNCMKFEKDIDGTDKITSQEFLAVGWTKEGLQVYCENCNTNVIDLDFLGYRVAIYNSEEKKRRGSRKTTDNGQKPGISGKK